MFFDVSYPDASSIKTLLWNGIITNWIEIGMLVGMLAKTFSDGWFESVQRCLTMFHIIVIIESWSVKASILYTSSSNIVCMSDWSWLVPCVQWWTRHRLIVPRLQSSDSYKPGPGAERQHWGLCGGSCASELNSYKRWINPSCFSAESFADLSLCCFFTPFPKLIPIWYLLASDWLHYLHIDCHCMTWCVFNKVHSSIYSCWLPL